MVSASQVIIYLRVHRPKRIATFLLKLVEKLIDMHIRETVLFEEPLNPAQHAYHSSLPTGDKDKNYK